jgi:hypothetical protein
MTLRRTESPVLDGCLTANASRLENCLRQGFAERFEEARHGNGFDILATGEKMISCPKAAMRRSNRSTAAESSLFCPLLKSLRTEAANNIKVFFMR